MEVLNHVGKIASLVGVVLGGLWALLRLTLSNYYTKPETDGKFMQEKMCEKEHVNLKDILHEMKEEIRDMKRMLSNGFNTK